MSALGDALPSASVSLVDPADSAQSALPVSPPPKVSPRGVAANRAALQQQIGQKIAQAAVGTVVLVEEETDIRVFPILRQMWMRMGEQLALPAPAHGCDDRLSGSAV